MEAASSDDGAERQHIKAKTARDEQVKVRELKIPQMKMCPLCINPKRQLCFAISAFTIKGFAININQLPVGKTTQVILRMDFNHVLFNHPQSTSYEKT